MKRWMKLRGMTLALALMLAVGAPVYVLQTPVEVSAKTVKKGLKLEAGKYYYYRNGVKVRGKWITIGTNKYYFKANGVAAQGWNKIGGKAYFFNTKAVMVKNREVDGVKLNAQGWASLNDDRVKLVFKVSSVVADNTKGIRLKALKMKACYNFIRLKCTYAGRFGSTDTSGWEVNYAYQMLDTRKGNCYSSAAAFGMLARKCGYDAKIVTGKISIDGAAEIDHAWVEINGKVYDPQTHRDKGISVYGISYQSTRVVYTVENKV